ncbi:MAG: HlyD family efflux transporter periplasmic adaptor subunit [Lachnospiraceae bacterium]|nr:HlyD family efflux transporter periplasmic adaptor subunit [Lachnospiraceae bacterium]
MKKILGIILITVLAGGAALGGIWGYRYMNREPEIEYETYTVGTADMTRKLTLDGEIQYSSTAAVYPEIQAVVAESSCQVGQAVQEGDTLYVLDDGDLQTQIAAVQSEYDQLDIQVRNTWGSEKKVNKVKRADAERRKADLEAELEKCTVTAPVSGVIISGSVREGQTVQKGAEDAKIVIAADHQYKIDIRVSQTYINDYKEGQEVEIEIPAAGRTVTGKITEINPVGTKENDITFFTVTAQFEDTEEAEESEEEDGEDSSIYSGMNARVTAVLEKKQGVTAIPEDLIDSEGCVLVMRGGEPEKVKLETGICDQGMTEVTEGLSEGDTIVYQTGDTDST